MSTNEPLYVALISLGCPKNLVDSERMLADLAEGGCVVGAPMEQADVIVVNTCGFLASAREEALEFIDEAIELKHAGSCKRVVVAGCLSSRDGEALYESADGIDAIVGVNDREKIVQAVLETNRQTFLTDQPQTFEQGARGDAGRFRLTVPHTAYLRIAEGCSRTCAFCTIPQIRGPFRSKPMDMVLAEAAELIESGALELNIIAQDTTNYGRDLTPPTTTAELIRQLDKLPGVQWIRMMYTYPNLFTNELRDAFEAAEHVIPYVDMPLQHISSSVLKRMRRGIDRAGTESLLHDLRHRMPDLAIRTSFIVGFPGETDEEFEELHDFIKIFPFDNMGVFEFSPEPGTEAYEMPDQIPADIAHRRAETLMTTQAALVQHRNEAKIGEQLQVLIDGYDEQGVCIGRYSGQAPDIDGVCLLTHPVDPGQFITARVVEADLYDLIVEPLEMK